jgi:hypothetical protein
MLLSNTNFEYVKLNRVKLKAASQKKITNIFKEFFEDIKGNCQRIKRIYNFGKYRK